MLVPHTLGQMVGSLGHSSLFAVGSLTVLAGSAISWLRSIPLRLAGAVERRFVLEAEIRDDWTIFEWTLTWLAAHPSMRRNRKWSVKTVAKGDITGNGCTNSSLPQPCAGSYATEVEPLLVPGVGTYLLWFERRPVILTRTQEEQKTSMPGGRARQHITVRMFTRKRERLQRLLGAIAESGQGAAPDVLRIVIADGASWASVDGIAKRPIETVILPDGIIERLLADIEIFLGAKSRYRSFGIPYHRGYAFFGPPGGGKTSMAQAIAGHFNLILNVLNLSSVWSDEQLFGLIRGLPPGSILLIEDIDAVTAVAPRQPADEAPAVAPEKGPGVSLSALLNVLDGVHSKDGMITFLTSNHPERLDPALLREGRIDVRVDLAPPTVPQAVRLHRRFFPFAHPAEASVWAHSAIDRKPCMAQLQGELARQVFQAVTLTPADAEAVSVN